MKRYDSLRADRRPVYEKALGLIYAMTDADKLLARLASMAGDKTPGQRRAVMFVGRRATTPAEA